MLVRRWYRLVSRSHAALIRLLHRSQRTGFLWPHADFQLLRQFPLSHVLNSWLWSHHLIGWLTGLLCSLTARASMARCLQRFCLPLRLGRHCSWLRVFDTTARRRCLCTACYSPCSQANAFNFLPGMAISLAPPARGAPATSDLASRLQSRDGWDADALLPGPEYAPGMHYWVLTDGWPTLFTVGAWRRQHARDDLARQLEVREPFLVIRATQPVVHDAFFNGYLTTGVWVATEGLSRVPFPSGAPSGGQDHPRSGLPTRTYGLSVATARLSHRVSAYYHRPLSRPLPGRARGFSNRGGCHSLGERACFSARMRAASHCVL